MSFDLKEYVRQSTQASGVPEMLEDPDVIYDAVVLLSRGQPNRVMPISHSRSSDA
jgi:hypothetical protein